MKKIISILLFIVLINHLPLIAQTHISDSLRYELLDFLITKNDFVGDTKTTETLLIINDLTSLKPLKNQKCGVFKFGTLTSHSYFHILLKQGDGYIIVDMKQPFEKIIPVILTHFKLNSCYSKADVVEYLKKITDLYLKNQDVVPWETDN
jgi:hypothetical protein